MKFGKLRFLVLFLIILSTVPVASAAGNDSVVTDHPLVKEFVVIVRGLYNSFPKWSETTSTLISEYSSSENIVDESITDKPVETVCPVDNEKGENSPGVASISSDKQKKLDQVTLSREATKVYVKNVNVVGSRAEVEFAFVGKYSHPVEGSARPFDYEYELPGPLLLSFLDESGNDVGGFQISTFKFSNGTVKVIEEDFLSGGTPVRMVASIYGNEVYSTDIPQQSMDFGESYEITQVYQSNEGHIAFDINVSNRTPSYAEVHSVYAEFRDIDGELVSPPTYFFEIIPEGNCGMSQSFDIPDNMTKGWVELRNVDGELLSKVDFDFNK